MAYEYLVDVRQLKKPLDAPEVLRELEGKGLKPVAVRVDNEKGQILVYFNGELDNEAKKKMDNVITAYLKNLR